VPDLGDTLPFRSDVYDKPTEDGGVLTNAASVALTVTLPDGTTATPTVTNPSTGKYAASYQTTLASLTGRYVGQWVFTFAGGATTSYLETFDVGGTLITVDEAIAHLRAAGIIASEADIDQLQWLCVVATDAVERDLGRTIVRRSITETHDGGRGEIVLRQTPVVSVTSINEAGTVLSASDYVVNTSTGILYRGSGISSWWFAWGRQNIAVTYVAGYTNPPPVVRKVALNTVQGMWQESQQAFHPGLEQFADSAVQTSTGALTQVERSAYNSLRSAGIA
jgi:hypothetical protein